MKYLVAILVTGFFIGCYSYGPRTYMNGDVICIKSASLEHAQMNMSDRQFVVNGDSTIFNEMRFYCVGGSMRTKQIMFDNHSRWDKAVYPEGSHSPMLIWENVDLLKNGNEYDVFVDGIESNKVSYSSIMVFDSKNQDVLSAKSIELDTLSKYFMALVKAAIDTSGYYEQYWKMVDPQHWERLQKIRNREEWPMRGINHQAK